MIVQHDLSPCPDCHIWHCSVCGCHSLARPEVASLAPVVALDVPESGLVAVELAATGALDVA